MTKLLHYDFDRRPRFVTFNTHKRLPLITTTFIRSVIIDAIKYCREKHPIKLAAYVVMPEHVHIILTPSETTEISKVKTDLKTCSSRKILSEFNRTNNPLLSKLTVIRNRTKRQVFWQRRFYDHNCRSEDSFWNKVNYCHSNPVRRGLVKSPSRWLWSSYNYYYRSTSGSLLEMDYDAVYTVRLSGAK